MGTLKTIPLPTLDGQTEINYEYINETLFVIPNNDGESLRANQILAAVRAPFHHISRQRWGAVFDEEFSNLKKIDLEKVKRVVLFELPGREQDERGELVFERRLSQMGLEVVIVDHHHYDWIDRHNEKSALEQLCALMSWQMDRNDRAIAVNDRSHIPGLKKLDLDISTIRQVRLFDLMAQGYAPRYIEGQFRHSQRVIDELRRAKIGGLWVLDNIKANAVIILQELALMETTGVVNVYEMRSRKLSFSGEPRVVEKLLTMDFSPYTDLEKYSNYGGGDGNGAKFWGFKLLRQDGLIPAPVRTAVQRLIVDTLSKIK